ncbi:MAG: hypothetical protein NT049_00025 [Planctomycetota bacterium]|nr:hypothetical protein [Planctomycetota bacterium]
MLKPVRLAAILAAALVAGCFEGKAEFDLNPDGSGKVVADFLFPSRAPWLLKKAAPHPADPSAAAAEPAANPEEDMNDCVGAFIKKSTGIDAWKDVSFQRAADGRIQFKGTAYFKDLTKVKVFPDDRAGRISFGPDGTTALTLILNRAKHVTEPP